MNFTRKVFTQNSSLTIPAGVTSVTVTAQRKAKPFGDIQITGSLPTAFIDSYGKLFMWGGNAFGQVGDGTVASKSVPTLVAGGLLFRQISGAKNIASIGLDSIGNLYGWGANLLGGLGAGDIIPRSSPTLVVGGLTWQSVVAVATGSNGLSSFGLTPSGVLYSWGVNPTGVLGLGDINNRSSPVAVVGGLTFQSLYISNSSVEFSAYGLTLSGTLYAWGANAVNGQLGVGDVTPRSSPVAVVGGLTFQSLAWGNGEASANNASVIGLTTAGAAYAWGQNAAGQLGDGTVTKRSSPVAVVGGLTFQSIYADTGGDAGSCSFGLTSAGALYAWGVNGDGQLGVGDTASRSSPTLVVGGFTWQSLAVNAGCVVGVTTNGTAYAWGRNILGQLGVGDVTPRSSPVAVVGGLTFQSVIVNSTMGAAASAFTTVSGVDTFGNLYAWGYNANGDVGDGIDVLAKSSPVLVVGGNQPKLADTNQSLKISVVPGTTYTISIHQFTAVFGNQTVGQGADALIVEYFQ